MSSGGEKGRVQIVHVCALADKSLCSFIVSQSLELELISLLGTDSSFHNRI